MTHTKSLIFSFSFKGVKKTKSNKSKTKQILQIQDPYPLATLDFQGPRDQLAKKYQWVFCQCFCPPAASWFSHLTRSHAWLFNSLCDWSYRCWKSACSNQHLQSCWVCWPRRSSLLASTRLCALSVPTTSGHLQCLYPWRICSTSLEIGSSYTSTEASSSSICAGWPATDLSVAFCGKSPWIDCRWMVASGLGARFWFQPIWMSKTKIRYQYTGCYDRRLAVCTWSTWPSSQSPFCGFQKGLWFS